MKRLNPQLLCIWVLLGLTQIANLAIAQDVVVEQFTAGEIIKSESVNNNFGKLAEKANDNGSRLSSVEGSLSAIDSAMTARSLRWLGYTALPFDAESNYVGLLSGYSLSMHCKSEFGPTAFVASDLDLEEVIRTGDFQLPPDGAYILFLGNVVDSGGYGSNAFFHITKSQNAETMLQSNGRISGANKEMLLPAACVAYE